MEPDSWEIAGADNKLVSETAMIDNDNDKVIVSTAGIDTPVAVRFGWMPESSCNLINCAGLPAFPFCFLS